MLQRLLYTSHAALGVPEYEQESSVRRLAQASAARNSAKGLTGVMLFVQGQFIQVLEGPGEALEEIFERICGDFRHRQVNLIDLGAVPTRIFSEWGMVSMTDGSETPEAIRASLSEIPYLAELNAREAILQIRGALDKYQETQQAGSKAA
ncbi:Photoactivated adenylate cyclase subunit alpha [Alteripontixanthobacter maritimus]|uniref:Photoactivated adenylate cyclase subunit alpha n=1 Tax=Alteripontixanthobacter maritimus TaxID=2161824 RepID=A0A369QEC7_9SPHN|nr:BLUF domain-containing protein [Alteripontixanthobacter maritimus]RDC60638.1 Photoactivated adenylate cyclase subunit alpha [Alteripontixanthobacter maritimus]